MHSIINKYICVPVYICHKTSLRQIHSNQLPENLTCLHALNSIAPGLPVD